MNATVRHLPEDVIPGRRLGRHVHHDPRSWAYRAATAAVRTVLHRHYGPALNQGHTSSCTGNACAQNLMTAPLHAPGRTLREKDALVLYGIATTLDPFPGQYPPDDTGSDGLSAAKAAQQKGLISGYGHAFGIDHAVGALMLGPIMVGSEWREEMDAPDASGLIRIGGQVRGGHEWSAIGYDQPSDEMIGLQSWGPSFGVKGVFRIARRDLAALLDEQGDVTVLRP